MILTYVPIYYSYKSETKLFGNIFRVFWQKNEPLASDYRFQDVPWFDQ